MKIALRCLRFVLWIISALIFYPMLFFRPFAQVFIRLTNGLMFLVVIISAIMGDADRIPLLIGVMFVLFLIGHFYDWLLLRLNPERTNLILFF